MDFKEFEKRVREHGLVARDCGQGHWRVEGGKYQVSWWPFSRRKTIYVNGQSRERTTYQGDLQKVLKLANKDPQFDRSRKASRKATYSRVKKRKFRTTQKCHWCSRSLEFDEATIDHVIPLARGGSNSDDNLVISCEGCNKAKGHKIWRKNADSGNTNKRRTVSSESSGEPKREEREGRSQIQDRQWSGYLAQTGRRCSCFIKKALGLNRD